MKNNNSITITKVKHTPSKGFILTKGTTTDPSVTQDEIMSCEALEQVYFNFRNSVEKQLQTSFCVLSGEQLLIKLSLS